MKIVGIVSEYNPFHNGHAYQIEHTKEQLQADGVIAIMSGHFVQRGTPAIFDKWTRAEMAVASGANLVLELPTYYATSSAEAFAHGAVKLLDATGVVTHISFGSENDDLERLKSIAYILSDESDALKDKLTAYMEQGNTFPKARELALKSLFPDLLEDFNMNQSNAILVIEYLKALNRLKSSINPFIVKRKGRGYHDTALNDRFASATGIREGVKTGKAINRYMPDAAYRIFSKTKYNPVFMEHLELPLLYKIKSSSLDDLSQIREMTEGLEHKIHKLAPALTSYEALFEALKSKRYTHTKISRLLLNILLDIKEPFQFDDEDHYFRVLAFDEVGQKIIRKIKKNGYYPLITNINTYKRENALLNLDLKATDIYYLSQDDVIHRKGGLDYLKKPYIHRRHDEENI